MLQRTWENATNWDEEVDEKTRKVFQEWLKDIHLLSQIKIPRWLTNTHSSNGFTLHMFSDASQHTYAAVAFLRIEFEDCVRVQLVSAKSKVAPVSKSSKRMTRLELLAASISARLYSTIVKDYGLQNLQRFFLTDATTVLARIKREDCWNVLVNNRISEIRRLTSNYEWRFVPGNKNPEDSLPPEDPSRGFSTQNILKTQWWVGQNW